MTPAEYQQLKAFARIDGVLLFLLWISIFMLYIKGLDNPMLSILSMLLLIISPFYVGRRLRKFRDKVREGVISFARGYAFIILSFFYSGLLFAVAMYVYFTYLDHGFLMAKFTEMANTPESVQMGLRDMMQQSINEISAMRPIDISINMLTIVIMAGFMLGMPIAAAVRRLKKVES